MCDDGLTYMYTRSHSCVLKGVRLGSARTTASTSQAPSTLTLRIKLHDSLTFVIVSTSRYEQANNTMTQCAVCVSVCMTSDMQVLMLCDCPGFMVGIESEQQAALRHMCRMMVLGGSVTVPVFLVVTRKAYGLGAQAMGVGSHHAPNVSATWHSERVNGRLFTKGCSPFELTTYIKQPAKLHTAVYSCTTYLIFALWLYHLMIVF